MFHIPSCEHSLALWGKCNFAYVELTLIIDHKKNILFFILVLKKVVSLRN